MNFFEKHNIDPENLLAFFPEGVVAFDLETTGLSPLTDKVIEIGAIRIDSSGKIDIFETFVNPKIPISPLSITIHKITDDMVADAPYLEDVLPSFFQFVGDLPLIAHNAKFDAGFMLTGLRDYQVHDPCNKIFDSCRLMRHIFPKLPSFGLKALITHFEIPIENHHRALCDTEACLSLVAKGFQSDYFLQKSEQILEKSMIFSLDQFDRNISFEVPKFLSMHFLKLSDYKILEIEYSGGNFPSQMRPVRPIGIIPYPNGPILQAFCLLTSKNKSFSLKKIKKFHIPENQETINPNGEWS